MKNKLYLNHSIFMCRVLWSVVTFLGVTSCSLVNQKPDQVQQSLEVLQGSIDANQQLNQQLTAALSELESKQALIENQLVDMGGNLSEIQRQNSDILSEYRAESQRDKGVQRVKQNKPTADKMVLGRVEWLWLPDTQRYFSAQVDTSLELSLIYANDITRFERDGKKWIRFSLMRDEWPTEFEAQVVRSDKQVFLGSTNEVKGSVVSLTVSLGTFKDAVEFLVVSKKKDYPQFVLARNFLTDIAIVDVALKYTVKKKSKLTALEASQKQVFVKTETSSNVREEAAASTQASPL